MTFQVIQAAVIPKKTSCFEASKVSHPSAGEKPPDLIFIHRIDCLVAAFGCARGAAASAKEADSVHLSERRRRMAAVVF